MALSIANNTSIPQPRASWFNDTRREALISSNTMLRDRFVKSGSSLTELSTAFEAPATLATRGTAVARAGRELSRSLDTAGKLGDELNHVLGDSPTYQKALASPVGKGFVGVTRAASATVAPVAETAGAVADLTKVHAQALKDFTDWQRVLADPHAAPALKIAATARATQSASALVAQQRTTLQVIAQADANYLTNPAYQKLTANMRESGSLRLVARMNGMLKPGLLKAAEVAGTSAGFVLGVITLPTMVASVQTTYTKLAATMADGGATDDQKLDAIADLSRATAGSVQGVEGIRRSGEALFKLAASSERLGGVAARVQSIGLVSQTASWFTRIMKVLSPVADLGMLIADGVKLKHVMADAKADGWTKARAILSVGLDGLKLATWLLPQTALVRLGYLAASFLQLGLAARDFGHSFGPFLGKVMRATGQVLTHPAEAFKAAGQALGQGMLYVSRQVYQAADLLELGLQHPSEAAARISAQVQRWWTSMRQVGTVLQGSAQVVSTQARGLKAAPAPTQPAATPPVLAP